MGRSEVKWSGHYYLAKSGIYICTMQYTCHSVTGLNVFHDVNRWVVMLVFEEHPDRLFWFRCPAGHSCAPVSPTFTGREFCFANSSDPHVIHHNGSVLEEKPELPLVSLEKCRYTQWGNSLTFITFSSVFEQINYVQLDVAKELTNRVQVSWSIGMTEQQRTLSSSFIITRSLVFPCKSMMFRTIEIKEKRVA